MFKAAIKVKTVIIPVSLKQQLEKNRGVANISLLRATFSGYVCLITLTDVWRLV